MLVEFFYLLSPGVMMREVWPATVITGGCLCVCVGAGYTVGNSLSELCRGGDYRHPVTCLIDNSGVGEARSHPQPWIL